MDFEFTEAQLRLRHVAREFAVDRVRPAVADLEGIEDPSETYPRSLIREASEVGLRTITLPRELGGEDADCLTEVLVLEELSYGDPGFGMTIQHGWREGRMLYDFGTAEQHERFLAAFVEDHTAVTALCVTEEHFGSDKVLPSDASNDAAAGPRTTARRDGEHWVVDGRKRWITNGNVAQLFFVVTKTANVAVWREGISVILVPSTAEGLRVGVVEDKVGLRLNQNAEVVLEECRVPVGNLLGPLDGGAQVLGRYRNGGTVKEASKALGCARAALEDAVAFSRSRVQGGQVIEKHQTVARSLAELATELEAARTLAWRAASAIDQGLATAHALSTMAAVTATNVVVKVALRAMELQGGHGIRRGTAAELNLRNAVSQMHAPASNDVMLEVLHRHLVATDLPYGDLADASVVSQGGEEGLL